MSSTYAEVAALISKLPAGNVIKKAYLAARKREADYAARGEKAWKSRKAAKRSKKSKAH